MRDRRPEIRLAQTSDAAEMARLSDELGYSISIDEMSAALRRLLADPRHLIAVADAGADRLLGWVHVEHPFYEALGYVREKTQHLYRKRFR